MILRVLYDSVFYLAVGNIWGIFLRIFHNQESPLWVSRFHGAYSNRKNVLFMFVWSGLATGIGLILILSGGAQFVVPTFFFVTGVMLLLGSISLLERIYIFPDRFEVRIGFQSVFRLYMSEVLYVLRDKKSKSSAHVLYMDPLLGVNGFGGGDESRYRMKIPVSLFRQGKIHINPSKLHPNIFLSFESAKAELPDPPIIRQQGRLKGIKLFFLASIVLINPYVLIFVATVVWGFKGNLPVLLFAFDGVNLYMKTVYQWTVTPNSKLDWKYVESHRSSQMSDNPT